MNPLGLDPERFVVAVDDASGAVVGFGQLKPWETLSDRPADDLVGVVVRGLGLTPNWSGRLLELASVVVSEPRRGEGIGRMIVDRLVAEAYESGVKEGAQEGAHGGAQEVTLCLLTLRESAGFYKGADSASSTTTTTCRDRCRRSGRWETSSRGWWRTMSACA